jgi:hypothetical protein
VCLVVNAAVPHGHNLGLWTYLIIFSEEYLMKKADALGPEPVYHLTTLQSSYDRAQRRSLSEQYESDLRCDFEEEVGFEFVTGFIGHTAYSS